MADSGRTRGTGPAVAGLMLALSLVAPPRIIADLGGFGRYAWATTAYLLAARGAGRAR